MTLWCWLPDMSIKPNLSPGADLERMYAIALQEYMQGGGEACLHRAYELGRQAIREGTSILEMIGLHHRALSLSMSAMASTAERVNVVEAGALFVAEAMSPYEMTNRAFGEAVAAFEHLNETLESEVKRIAQALHDDAGQLMAVVHIKLEDISRTLPIEVRERLQDVRRVLDQIEDQLRELAHELRPAALGTNGLSPALHNLALSVSQRTKLRVTLESAEVARLPIKIEAALYRVVQEALTNASKHAHARTVTIRLRSQDDSVSCSVEDDGAGFDHDARLSEKMGSGLGLLGIRERLRALGGSFEIQSAPGSGTRLTVRIPLEKN